MKKIYLLILLLCTATLSAQENAANNNVTQVNTNEEIEGFRMFPNPVTKGKINIYTRKNLSKQIAIYDLLGKQVLRKLLTTNTLDVSDISNGVYILRVSEGKKISTRKLVIRQ
jgi:putative component of toxin-antitoxin plasmid stabilization module